MKFTIQTLFFVACMVLVSCGQSTPSGNELDSLRNVISEQQEQLKASEQVTDALCFSMDSVINANDIIFSNREGITLSKDKLKRNIDAYENIIENQKQRVRELQELLANQKSEYAQKMKQTLARLQKQLDAKNIEIAELKEQLHHKDINISELSNKVANLGQNVNNLQNRNYAQKQTLQTQSDMMNEAFYIIGTKKELISKGLLSGGGFLSKKKLDMTNVKTEDFIKIDMRTTQVFIIPGKNPKVLTQKPSDSYTITKDASGSILTIKDVTRFWSVSNYLVIQY